MSNLKITFDIREYVCNESKVPDLDVYVNHLPIILIDIIASYFGYYKYRPGFGRCRQLDMSHFNLLKVLFRGTVDSYRIDYFHGRTFLSIARKVSHLNTLTRIFKNGSNSHAVILDEYRTIPSVYCASGRERYTYGINLEFDFAKFIAFAKKDEADF